MIPPEIKKAVAAGMILLFLGAVEFCPHRMHLHEAAPHLGADHENTSCLDLQLSFADVSCVCDHHDRACNDDFRHSHSYDVQTNPRIFRSWVAPLLVLAPNSPAGSFVHLKAIAAATQLPCHGDNSLASIRLLA